MSLDAGCGSEVAMALITRQDTSVRREGIHARVKTGQGLFPPAQCGRAQIAGRGRTAAHRTAYTALPCRIAGNQKGGQPQ